MVEKNRMITYIPYQHSIKAILLFAFLLQCCQSHPHAFEEAMSAQEASSASDVQQQSSSEVALDPIVILSAFSLDECILPAHRASGTAGAPVQSTPSIFTASSGESVQFIQLDAQWHAVVLDDKTQILSQQTLPVRSGDKDIDRLIAQLQLLDKRSSKTRIHVLQKNYSPERTACVYLGQLGLLGGMPKNKRLQEEGIVERKLLRAAMRQPTNLSTEQEGEITAAKSDAILGCNGPTKGDRKGSFYEQLIDELWGEYASIPLIEKEDFVVNKVMNPVRKQGGRFMRWDSNKNQYRVMEEREEREIAKTVMQALRDRRKSTPEKPKKRPSAQGIECTPPLRQEANCPEQDYIPLGMSITELSYWQGYEEAPDQQAHYSEQDSKPPAIDSLHGKKQGIIQPEQPMYTFTLYPENLVPQRTNDESRMGLSSGMPKNKRQQEKSMAEHKLLRAAQQSVNLSTEQESGVTTTKEDATLGHMGPTKGDRKESFYKQLIDVLWDDYGSIPLTEKWKFVVDKVINPIHGRGGRFVRWDADKQQYRVMEGEEITKKVMQALRNGRKNTPGKPKEGTCAQGIEYAQPLRQGANCSEQDCDPFGVSTVASSHGQERGKSPERQTHYSRQDLESLGVSPIAFPDGQERGKSPERQTHYSRQDLEFFGVSTAELSYLRELAPAEALYRQDKEALYRQDKYLGQDSESFGVPNAVFPYRQKYEETPKQQANNCPEQDGKLSAIDSLHRKRQDLLQPKHPIYTLQLRDSDAILGCNGPTKADRKGSFYEQLIHVLWDDYSRINLTEKEDFVVNRVINPVRKQNGRFMRWDTNKKQYRVMEESEEKEIAKTVMQALRDRRKNMPRKYKGETYAQGIEHILPLRQEASCPERDLEPLGMATPELPHGQEQAKLPDQQPSCPEQDLEPLGVSATELPHGQEHVEAPEQRANCPEQDLEPLGVSDPELPHM
jgi:hypothetical protein